MKIDQNTAENEIFMAASIEGAVAGQFIQIDEASETTEANCNGQCAAGSCKSL